MIIDQHQGQIGPFEGQNRFRLGRTKEQNAIELHLLNRRDEQPGRRYQISNRLIGHFHIKQTRFSLRAMQNMGPERIFCGRLVIIHKGTIEETKLFQRAFLSRRMRVAWPSWLRRRRR